MSGRRRRGVLAALLLAAGVLPLRAQRALVVSFDGLAMARALATVDADAIPAFRALWAEASCAAQVRPAFPSVTAAGHAAIWTGAYGDVSGISANAVPVLPWASAPADSTRSGYFAEQLRAEPLWLAAVAAGRRATGHHATQSPEAPGRRQPEGGRDAAAVRREAALVTSPRLLLLNGYNRALARGEVLTAATHAPRPARPWRGLAARPALRQPPREVAWAVGGDSVFALFTGTTAYDRVFLARRRDLAGAVEVRPHAAERAPLAGRALARHFAAPLPLAGGRAFFRLFALAPDLSDYVLLRPGLFAVDGNDRARRDRYIAATGGFYGNTESRLLEDGRLGQPLEAGGDGEAEWRYLETAELLTRQFLRGSAWSWRTQRPDVQLDYTPLVDDLDHLWYGLAAAEAPGVDPGVRTAIRAMRSRGWALADRHLATLRAQAAAAGALLVVTADHGMRATWRSFRVNAALREAGLLAVDDSGRVILALTRALSPNGYYVVVNRTRRPGGIVTEAEAGTVLDSVDAVLRAVRDPDGRAVVTQTWRPVPDDSLGIGGPAGGELYFALAPGTAYGGASRGAVLASMTRPTGSHGFPSTDPDMSATFCVAGPGIGGRRLPEARLIDVAPTVAEWLRVPAPREARGRSRLAELRR